MLIDNKKNNKLGEVLKENIDNNCKLSIISGYFTLYGFSHLKTELEKVQRKGRTKAEKLLYTKKRVEEQLKELGIEEESDEDEDDQPVTLGMLKKLQAETAVKSALELADDITNDTERELVKWNLENRIKSTGNPQEDYKLARTLVNAIKNSQVIEEQTRKPETKSYSSASGAPPKQVRPAEELSATELEFTRPPFNLTKEQIIAARPK